MFKLIKNANWNGSIALLSLITCLFLSSAVSIHAQSNGTYYSYDNGIEEKSIYWDHYSEWYSFGLAGAGRTCPDNRCETHRMYGVFDVSELPSDISVSNVELEDIQRYYGTSTGAQPINIYVFNGDDFTSMTAEENFNSVASGFLLGTIIFGDGFNPDTAEITDNMNSLLADAIEAYKSQGVNAIGVGIQRSPDSDSYADIEWQTIRFRFDYEDNDIETPTPEPEPDPRASFEYIGAGDVCQPFRINGSGSTDETAHWLEVFQVDDQTEVADGTYWSSGWIAGQAGIINISQPYGWHTVQSGATYAIKLAVGDPWHQDQQFITIEGEGPNSEFTLYPLNKTIIMNATATERSCGNYFLEIYEVAQCGDINVIPGTYKSSWESGDPSLINLGAYYGRDFRVGQFYRIKLATSNAFDTWDEEIQCIEGAGLQINDDDQLPARPRNRVMPDEQSNDATQPTSITMVEQNMNRSTAITPYLILAFILLNTITYSKKLIVVRKNNQ